MAAKNIDLITIIPNCYCGRKMVRCTICRLHFSNLRALSLHYRKHSKCKIIKYFLKFSVLLSIPNVFRKRYRTRQIKQESKQLIEDRKLVKAKTLYINGNFHILCSQHEVIISDGQNGINSLFSFEVSSKKNGTLKSKVEQTLQSQNKLHSYKNHFSSRSSASSEGSSSSLNIKRKVKRKKQSLKGHYHINITKQKNLQPLDDQTGEFYTCSCRSNKLPKSVRRSDLKIITSDTESCSDTGKTLFQPIVDTKLFCTKCGNGYKTKAELTEHMYIHETFCRLCNTAFANEYTFKEHMRLHIFKVYICHICNAEFPFKDIFYKHFETHVEDRTLENVLDMEEDYKTLQFNFLNMDYNASINSILHFLNEYDYRNINYSVCKYFKIHCPICRNEVLICDYEAHLQSLHSNLFY